MVRKRGENLRSIFVLLFLNVAFFLLERQDPQKFRSLFAFERDAVLGGQWWRVFTYQFTQAGSGWMELLALFVTLLLLYMMGSAIEEEWGSGRFLTLFIVSTLGSAGFAALLDIPLLGTYFIFFTLLFVYAAEFPQQTFYLFGAMPVRVRILAAFSAVVLIYGVFAGAPSNLAALGGAVAGYIYYLLQRMTLPRPEKPAEAELPPVNVMDTLAMRNGVRYAAMKQALHAQSAVDVDRLATQCEREIVGGVNVCPPADFKPEHSDGYCIRCEGFAECSTRFLRANRPAPMPPDAEPQALV
ncbi:MAG TPA: rhomboid family intramembrane serine protease [Thermoanaerobaculia bacterium]